MPVILLLFTARVYGFYVSLYRDLQRSEEKSSLTISHCHDKM
jgi:hypothetical protein